MRHLTLIEYLLYILTKPSTDRTLLTYIDSLEAFDIMLDSDNTM